ncbi:hypothetical protein NA57DRAFT_57054 [Rhizodiscina lignyota]|uniref:Uncharacterized protein n=1 Tax=Rhizodiscina lignyota TaxID=1504668 RepID=A0A9P4IG54_9PEZI|nr:hypothetical protein NA57DRAFT_57054 [Rhizodiscina lignyota]
MPSSATGPGQRPEIQRLRSNSVPIAVSLMDCTAEEAGLLFSAAERASARRRKHLSVDHTHLSPQTSEERIQAFPTTVFEDTTEDDIEIETPSTEDPTTPRPSSEEIPLQASPEVKAYNQDMVRFIQGRLHSMALSYCEPPPTPKTSVRDEPEEYDFSPVRPQRPQLKSHFSNWSTTSAGSDGPEVLVDLASSPPPATDDSVDPGDKEIERGYAHIVPIRRRADMEKPSPSYFSWPVRPPKPAHASINFETPLSSELRSSNSCSKEGTPPLIDLDTSQPDVSRASRGDFFFNLSAPRERHLTPSPDPRGLTGPPLHMGQHLPSPRPIRC